MQVRQPQLTEKPQTVNNQTTVPVHTDLSADMSNKDDEKDLHSVTQVQADDSNDLSPEYHEYQELATKFDESRLKALCVGLPLTLGWKSSS